MRESFVQGDMQPEMAYQRKMISRKTCLKLMGLCSHGYDTDKISDVSQDTWDDKARNILFWIFINVSMFSYKFKRSVSVKLQLRRRV